MAVRLQLVLNAIAISLAINVPVLARLVVRIELARPLRVLLGGGTLATGSLCSLLRFRLLTARTRRLLVGCRAFALCSCLAKLRFLALLARFGPPLLQLPIARTL
jgi:hypothetical protein